jgi:DNA-binding protein H-NS
MKIDLSGLSVVELNDLQHEISVEIESRGKEERQKLLQEFRERAKALGVSLEDLMSGQKAKSRNVGKVAAKYANPADASQTWTGRGKRPRWVNDCLATGKELDDLKV